MTEGLTYEGVLATPMETHDLEQGSDAWMTLRLTRRGASEAAAMLGVSKKVKRTELLRAKSTGIAKEFSDWVQENILDYGHEVEAKARALLEEDTGEELYPVTCSRGPIVASSDGATFPARWAMEHKQWNEELAAAVAAGKLPVEHRPQCQQTLLVIDGLQFVRFIVSDGTREKRVMLDVYPDEALQRRIVAGWNQFDKDLAEFKPATPAIAVVAEPVQALPSVIVKVEGAISIQENFDAFETAARDFLEHRLIREPKTDQDFADLDVQIKAMKGAEAALDAAEANWIAQIDAVGTAKRRKDMLAKLMRDSRLMAEKLLASEKDRRRMEIVTGAQTALGDHLRALNKRLGRDFMPQLSGDFAGAIRGKKSLASMQDAVDTVLANCKIEANETADKIDANLKVLAAVAQEHAALFPDASRIVLKEADDFRALVSSRVAEHEAAVKKRAEEAAERERARIRAEEEERARAQAAREQQERETAERLQREEAEELQRQQEQAAAAPAPVEHPHGPAAGQAHALFPDPQPAAPAPAVIPMPTRAAAPAGKPTLSLGQLKERIAPLLITAEGMATLGFTGLKDRGSVLFHEADYPHILAAIVAHVQAIQAKQAA